MTQSFQQLLVTNYGLLPSGYTGSQGIQGVPGTSDSTPKITAIAVTDSSYTVLDDTAVDVAGGYVQLTGTGFASGCVVMINNVPATSTTFVSSTQVQAQLPATAAGTYVVYLVNADGAVAIRINGITFSATPAWTTASSLPGVSDGAAISIQLAAAGASTYALAAGSSLPGTITLTSGGLLSGVVSGLENETTYSFTVVATDAELQDSPRTFSITITAGDPLFAATTLLLPGSVDTFVRDASTNNFAVTIAGDTRPNTFNPYLTGWSNYFDGSGDYLTVPANAAFDITSGSTDSFIFEAWVNWSTVGANMSIIDNGGLNGASFSNWTIYLNASSQISIAWGDSAAPGGNIGILPSTTVPVIGQWYHLALVKTNADWALFIDGTRAITYNGLNTAAKSNSTALYIGFGITTGAGGAGFAGYISNVRIYKGATASAPYDATSTTITVPTAPLTTITNTSLLTCQSNRFIDNSVNNFAITHTGDVAVRSFSPFAEPATTRGSAYFDGSDYLSLANNDAFNCGTGDFTLETWYYHDGGTALYPSIFSSTDWSTGTGGVGLRFNNTGMANKFGFFWYGVGDPFLTASFTSAPYAWHHVAVTRSGNTFTLWVDGVSAATGTASGTINFNLSTGGPRIGWGPWDGSNGYLKAYLNNLRLVKGTALYTTAFTPPTAPLTAVAGTSLLTLQNNQPHNNSQFLDSSTNNLLVTRAGNATQGTSSPYSPSGWSNYFDGTGDYLSLPTSAAILGSGNFTIELWVYPQLLANLAIIDTRGASTSTNGWLIHYGSDRVFRLVNDGNNVITTTTTAPLNEWTHIAVCRVGSTVTFYVNGVASGTATNSSAFDPSSLFYIGIKSLSTSANVPFLGYMSNIRLVSGTAVYTANFTPSTQPLTAVASTSLLTCQSPQFVDNSPNRSAITRNGDVRVQNFSPFKAVTQTPISYSAYFDGSGDYLTFNGSSAMAFGTVDFTIECWVNVPSIAAYNTIIDARLSDGAVPYAFSITNSGTFAWYNGSADVVSTSALSINSWTHIAISRSGTTLRFFINGVAAGSSTDSINYSSTNSATRIGANLNTATNPYRGYISNLRVVKGTAVYTADFTPPTQPLTAIANTSLLTCQSPTFVDNSTNNFAITAAGNTQPTTVNPFGSTSTNSTGYTAAEYGGSMSFDGSGDYLTIPSSSLFQITGDFTIEAYVYATTINTFQNILSQYLNSTNAFACGFNSTSGWYFNYRNNTTEVTNYRAGTSPLNTWVHVAFVKSSTTMTVYINGTALTSTITVPNLPLFAAPLYVGLWAGASDSPWVGYISNLRMIKGQAIYTSNFVPPIAPVTPTPNTVLLLNGTGAAITDATTKNVLETVGDAKISTAVSKFGGSSMSFDGSGDYIVHPSSINYGYGTGDFTIEFWVYFNAISLQTIASNLTSASSVNPHIYLLGSDGTIRYYTNNADRIVGSVLSINTWYHVAVCRAAGSTRLFINGTQSGSTYVDSNNYGASAPLGIGTYHSAGSPFTTETLNGYIQDLRITKTARYTANFTPPTAAFQTR